MIHAATFEDTAHLFLRWHRGDKAITRGLQSHDTSKPLLQKFRLLLSSSRLGLGFLKLHGVRLHLLRIECGDIDDRQSQTLGREAFFLGLRERPVAFHFEVFVGEAGQHFPLPHSLAGEHLERFQTGGFGEQHPLHLPGVQRHVPLLVHATHRQRHEEEGRDHREQRPHSHVDTSRFHVRQTPPLPDVANHPEDRPDEHRRDREDRQHLAQDFELGCQEVRDEEDHPEHDHPFVHPACDGIHDEEEFAARCHVDVRRHLNTQALLQKQIVEIAIGLLTKVRHLEPVRQDVVTVEPHERVGIEHHGAHGTEHHDAQSHVVRERIRWRVPPHERCEGRDDQLNVDACEANDDAFPLVR